MKTIVSHHTKKSMEFLDEKAFREGMIAFSNPEITNPYIVKEGVPHKEWNRGWEFSYFKALRKCKSIERSRERNA